MSWKHHQPGIVAHWIHHWFELICYFFQGQQHYDECLTKVSKCGVLPRLPGCANIFASWFWLFKVLSRTVVGSLFDITDGYLKTAGYFIQAKRVNRASLKYETHISLTSQEHFLYEQMWGNFKTRHEKLMYALQCTSKVQTLSPKTRTAILNW